jgi:hypothetical protein
MPPGLAPIGPNTADLPAAQPDDPYPETYNQVSGATDAYAWSALKGYIKAPIAAVWAGMQEPDTVVDRRKVNSWTVTPDVETGYDVSFMVDETVDDVITVEFQMTWRQSHTAGTVDAPTAVAANYQKTYGSDVIKLIAGSIELERIDDETTSFACLEYVASLVRAQESVDSFQPDLYNSVKARAHGDPLPTY